jgi:hypothetical protein
MTEAEAAGKFLVNQDLPAPDIEAVKGCIPGWG